MTGSNPYAEGAGGGGRVDRDWHGNEVDDFAAWVFSESAKVDEIVRRVRQSAAKAPLK